MIAASFCRAPPALPTRLFLKVWPFLLIAPLALLVFAIWERIAAYGLTPDRYLLALFAVLLAVILLLQIDRRWRDDIRVIPGTRRNLASLRELWSLGDDRGFRRLAGIARLRKPTGCSAPLMRMAG